MKPFMKPFMKQPAGLETTPTSFLLAYYSNKPMYRIEMIIVATDPKL
jgi:hypothetical protein